MMLSLGSVVNRVYSECSVVAIASSPVGCKYTTSTQDLQLAFTWPGTCSVKCRLKEFVCKEFQRRRALTCLAAENSSQPSDTTRPQSVWPLLLPRPFIYSSQFSDVDPVQLSELWATTLKVSRDPRRILKALRHSFAFIVVLAEVHEDSASGIVRRLKTVGVGRAISDGAFIATICDVAVDPAYQRRGIGRRIVKKLVQNMKKTGGPSGYAVFPPPVARRFFFFIGFRYDKKYRMMAYVGKGVDGVVDLSACEDTVGRKFSVKGSEQKI